MTPRQKEKFSKLKKEHRKYKRGFEIMIEYFDSISDEEQPIVNRKLNRLGL